MFFVNIELISLLFVNIMQNKSKTRTQVVLKNVSQDYHSYRYTIFFLRIIVFLNKK